MATSKLFKSKKRTVFLLFVSFVILSIAFLSGFAFAKASQNTKWVGWLVYCRNPIEYETVPSPGVQNFSYSRNVVLGLRNDGVVVWKRKSAY